MSTFKHNCTKGPAWTDPKEPFRVLGKSGSQGQSMAPIAECPGYQRPREANAQLIAEAFTVLHETGMTPRELADLLDRLAELLADIQNRNDDRPRELTHGEYDDLCAIVTSYEQAEP